MALYAVVQGISSARWMWLARPLGFEQSWGRFISYYYIGMFFNLVLPTSVGGDVVRAWYLDGRSGRRLAAFLSVLVDRASGLFILVVLAGLGVAVCPIPLPGWVPWLIAALTAAGAVGGLVLLAACGPGERVRGLAAQAGWRGRLGRLIQAVFSLRDLYLPRPGLLAGTTLLSVVVQAANILLVVLVARALGLEVPATYFCVIIPVITLLTLIPVSLNGMGVREGATVLLLAPLGVSTAEAVSLAFLWFLAFSLTSLAGAGFYLLGRHPRYEVPSHDQPVGGDSDQGRAGELDAAA